MRAVALVLRWCIGVVILASVFACQRHSPARETGALEPYLASAGAVGFDIFPLGGSAGEQNWLAAYTEEGRNAKFHIELEPAASGDNGVPPSGQGKLVSELDSDSLPLLQALKAALQAKRLPTKIERADALAFNYVIVGQDQTRAPDGSFRGTPKGNWTALKLSLGKGEIFLNINPVAHKAEFAIKDPASGDIVLAELARVL